MYVYIWHTQLQKLSICANHGNNSLVFKLSLNSSLFFLFSIFLFFCPFQLYHNFHLFMLFFISLKKEKIQATFLSKHEHVLKTNAFKLLVYKNYIRNKITVQISITLNLFYTSYNSSLYLWYCGSNTNSLFGSN